MADRDKAAVAGAGWYPGQRAGEWWFWDGTQWTASAPMAAWKPTVASAVPAETRKQRSGWYYLAVIVGLSVLMGLAMVGTDLFNAWVSRGF